MNKGIIICADDYAQSAAVSNAILVLLKQHRINATSCLVNSPYWNEAAEELESYKADTYVGLHLNLIFGQPLSSMWRKYEGERFHGFTHLMQRAYLRRLKFDVVKAEIQAQINMFAQMTDCFPDFIDGHLHTHQLPVVRDALLALFEEQKLSIFIRNTYNGCSDFMPRSNFPKPQALALLGGKTLRKKLIAQQIATNTSFAGIYRFSQSRKYRYFFKRFLALSQDGGLIMCHPGHFFQDTNDPIFTSREYELDYLQSDEFLQDLKDNSCHLLRKIDLENVNEYS